jgi:hypothetical protein
MKVIVILVLIMISSCKMPESHLKNTELYGLPNSKLVYEGNTVWLINHTENGSKRIDDNGIYKIEYEFVRVRDGYLVGSLKFYDSTDNLIDTNSNNKYAQVKTKYYRNGNIKEELFYDNFENLYQVSYLGYARRTRKYYKDGSWVDNYYDSKNKPRCGNRGFEIKQKWDTIHLIQADTSSYMLRILEVYKLDCNMKKL